MNGKPLRTLYIHRAISGATPKSLLSLMAPKQQTTQLLAKNLRTRDRVFIYKDRVKK
jgi:hypothetical protein